MTPEQYCEDKTRGSGSSFFYALIFLPAEKRRAMMALYAFCREVDDVADNISDAAVAMQKLQFWREELERIYQQQARHPVGRALMPVVQDYHLPQELFEELIDGMHMDIARTPILSRADLSLYCYRVAGVVGLLSIQIFGAQHRNAQNFAKHWGEALQITNILRDIEEDGQRQRLYLPQQDLIRFQVADQDLFDGKLNEHSRALLQYYDEEAEQAYQKALDYLPEEDRQALRPALVMGLIYHQQLLRIRRSGYDVWNQKNRQISPLRKIWIAASNWKREARRCRKGLPVQLN